jgi:hypothetical protein
MIEKRYPEEKMFIQKRGFRQCNPMDWPGWIADNALEHVVSFPEKVGSTGCLCGEMLSGRISLAGVAKIDVFSLQKDTGYLTSVRALRALKTGEGVRLVYPLF